jgi:hypothetical protein
MANVQISQLPAAGSITGTELVPVVQNGVTVQTTTGAIAASPSQTQTFVTVNQEPSLPNSRAISGGTGVGVTDNGAQSTIAVSLNGVSGSLESAGNGMIAKVGGSAIARTIAATGAGLTVTNGDGQSGAPTIGLSGLPLSLAGLSGSGILALPNNGTVTARVITATANQTSVTDGDGASGNPTIGLASNPILPGTASTTLPIGDTVQRGTAANGQIRYNTDTSRFEGYQGGSWYNFGRNDGTVTQVTGTPNQIAVANQTTTPVVSIVSDPVLPGLAGVVLPTGSTGQRAITPTNGTLRYNSTTGTFEGYANSVWGAIVTGSGVTSVATGTGLTGGPITSTGTISIANTAVTAASYGSATAVPTYTVNAQGQLTSAANVSIAIPSSAITDKGLANGIATLDSGGKVPISELPAAILGALSYQGTWNASTNTPTLASGVGTKGYYYVVSVAGSTNLDGITSWNIGDWAVYNGTAWQKVDNTDAVTSVNGYTGAVVLAASDVGAPTTSGTGATGTWAIGISGNAATATSATTSTNIAGGASGSLPYQSATSTTGMIAAGTNGYLLTMNAGIPSWQPAPATGVTSISFDTTGLTPATSTTGAVTVGGTLVAANGGTGQSSYTAGDLLYASGSTAISKIAIGTSGQILTVSGGIPSWQPAPATGVTSFSAGTTGLTPSTGTTGAVTLAGTLAVANGGTNGTATPTAGTVAYGTGTAYAFTSAGTAGQVLQSNGSSAPTWVTPAGGVTLSNDTSTASNLYPTFASATSGSVSTIFTGNARLLYKPSTGELQSTVLNATNGIVVNSATVSENYTIPSGSNAISAGPVTVNSGITVTVSSGSVWVVA